MPDRPGQPDPWRGVGLWDRLTLRVRGGESHRHYGPLVPYVVIGIALLIAVLVAGGDRSTEGGPVAAPRPTLERGVNYTQLCLDDLLYRPQYAAASCEEAGYPLR